MIMGWFSWYHRLDRTIVYNHKLVNTDDLFFTVALIKTYAIGKNQNYVYLLSLKTPFYHLPKTSYF